MNVTNRNRKGGGVTTARQLGNAGREGMTMIGLLLLLLAVAAAVYWWRGKERGREEEGVRSSPSRQEPVSNRPDILREAAEQGDPAAASKLGLMYAEGLLVPQDWRQAAAWYRKAAQGGNPDGQYQLGVLFETGNGMPRNLEQAAEWYRKAAEQGHPDAEWKLGMFHRDGLGVAKDPIWAKIWLEKAARQGHEEARQALARLAVSMERAAPKPASVDLAEAEAGNADAQFRMGRRCMEGIGVPQNGTLGAEWYRKAAEQGHAGAQCRLGDCFRLGRGVAKDEAAAERWYRAAAEQGHAEAQRLMGQWRMAAGARAEALVWLKDAADGGDPEGQYLLALCYQKGMGTAENPALAKKWIRTAAQNGHTKAKSIVAAMDRDAGGTEAGLATRASRGDAQAQFDLGKTLLEEGREKEGMELIQAAAQGGLVEAGLWMGLHYQFGLGVGGDRGTLGNGGDTLGQILSGP